MSVRNFVIDCVHGGKVIASYPVAYSITIGPSAPPSRQQFIADAQLGLSNDRLAQPPFAGIEYVIREV